MRRVQVLARAGSNAEGAAPGVEAGGRSSERAQQHQEKAPARERNSMRTQQRDDAAA